MQIDIGFDFRSDARGLDPDAFSPTLRRYHQALWSQALPCGRWFKLNCPNTKGYLYHNSEIGEFNLASDTMVPTFKKWSSMKHIIDLISEEEQEAFERIRYTIGGMLIFPGNTIGGKPTINVARGFNRKIADRFDLTLECIRRHYIDHPSPLSDTLKRYSAFFGLFVDFRSYVEFFMLQDLVSNDHAEVKFFMPFDNFGSSAVPRLLETYAEYRNKCCDFIEARNRRIDEHFNSRNVPTDNAQQATIA